MKLVKMSLAAAMLMGVSAFAVDNVKISGDAKIFYSTQDAPSGYDAIVGKDGSLFEKDSSAADAALHLSVTADLLKNVSAGASYTAISTLGLENNFVSNVWAGSHTATAPTGASYGGAIGGAKVENASWFNEAWAAVSLGKTTAKLGRMELDTPLAFTETWTIERNSFEGAVLLNQDLPDTTLVAAYVGNGNGTETFGQNAHSNVMALGLAMGAVVNADGKFTTYGTDGAYAYGIINNSFKPLTVQAWYYDVTRLAQAYWLQADLNMEGIIAGAQYSGINLDTKSGLDGTDSSIYALMIGYSTDAFTVKGSYSSVDKDFAAGFNTATASGYSKIYTEAWWNYGYVTAADSDSFNITATANLAGFGLEGYYTNATGAKNADGSKHEVSEVTLGVTKSFGPLDTALYYINTDAEDQNNGDAYNMVQAYLTLNF